MTIRVTYLIISIYIMLLWVFLNIWGINAVEGHINLEFYADSETYMEYAKSNITFMQMLALNPNLIGPVCVSRALLNNYNLIFAVNSLLLFLSFKLIVNNFQVNPYYILGLLLISPMLTSSVLTINKEIFSVLSTVLLLVYIKKRKIYYFVFSLSLAFIVRWQHVAFILTIVATFSRINPFRRNLFLSFFLLLTAVSLVYPLGLGSQTEYMMSVSENLTSEESGSGFYFLMNSIQSVPLGYIIVFLPKLFLTLFALLTKISFFGDMDVFYNYTIVLSQCFLYLGIAVLLLVRNKIKIREDLFFITAVYCLLFTLSPIFAPRYLFIFYILSVIMVSEKTLKLNYNPINNDQLRHNRLWAHRATSRRTYK